MKDSRKQNARILREDHLDFDSGPLFEPKKLARRHDPNTSKAAAKSCAETRNGHFRAILVAMRAGGQPNMTAEEIADRIGGGIHRVQVCKRFAEMRRAGMIEPTGECRKNRNGRSAACYALP